MAFEFSNNGINFEPAPMGSHPARCIKVIDLGTQTSDYQGQPNIRRQVTIAWELPNELMTTGPSAGKPFLVSKTYTASLGEKANLRKDLEAWRGRAFSPDELRGFAAKNILGKTCMVAVAHTDSGKAKVSGVIALPKGMEVPPQVNPSVYFSLEPDEFNQQAYEALGNWHKEMIAKSPEYARHVGGGTQAHGTGFDDMDEDIQF